MKSRCHVADVHSLPDARPLINHRYLSSRIRTAGSISIEFTMDGPDLSIRVSNPVSTANATERKHRGHQIGLAATLQRLERRHPLPGRLVVERGSDRFVATAVLPSPPQATTR